VGSTKTVALDSELTLAAADGSREAQWKHSVAVDRPCPWSSAAALPGELKNGLIRLSYEEVCLMTKPARLPGALSRLAALNGSFRSPPSGVCGQRGPAKGRATGTRRLLCQ
jgi:hypothetical protein